MGEGPQVRKCLHHVTDQKLFFKKINVFVVMLLNTECVISDCNVI